MVERRKFVLLGAFALGGALFGFSVSSIPSPSDPTMFWVGNFSSPWALLAFLAGWSQRSWLWAACAGALADIACVVGFYFRFLTLDPDAFGLPRSTDVMTVALTSAGHWIVFVSPWIGLAVGAGLIYGSLGRWWGRSRSLVAGAAVAVPFVAEPLLWPIYDGFYKGPTFVWIAEAVVGLLVLSWVVIVWRRSRAMHVAQ
jgi:hypothetical protein